jgi:hypothetical protein
MDLGTGPRVIQRAAQGADAATHVSVENINTWREQDPAFWLWLLTAYWDARKEHTSKKKAS